MKWKTPNLIQSLLHLSISNEFTNPIWNLEYFFNGIYLKGQIAIMFWFYGFNDITYRLKYSEGKWHCLLFFFQWSSSVFISKWNNSNPQEIEMTSYSLLLIYDYMILSFHYYLLTKCWPKTRVENWFHVMTDHFFKHLYYMILWYKK